jgi:tRNA G10  N-methylase Trm11
VPYRFEQERRDYTDLSAGRVLRGLPGATAFPVRLASELVQRALSHADRVHAVLYDPCCGCGYLLTAIGFLHGARLQGLVGSDINGEAVSLCEQNLALLEPAGLEARIEKLTADIAAFGKDAHREARASAERLRTSLPPRRLTRLTFVADAGDPHAIEAGLRGLVPDIVIGDLPYGRASGWSGASSAGSSDLLASLAKALPSGTIVALATSKLDRPASDCYERLERWQVGRRALSILRLR